MKTTLITFYSLLLIFHYSHAQVPADSLPGTYAGQYWYANPATNPWTIIPDTVFVSNIDSLNCKVQSTDIIHFTGYPTYYTDYYSCNSLVPSNFYTKFYSIDSLRIIIDNAPQPFPDPPNSWRFYGKRLNHLTGINKVENPYLNVLVSPNPANKEVTIKLNSSTNNNFTIKLINCLGQEVFSKQKPENTENIDISMLPTGMYVINIYGNNFSKTKKLIIVH